MTVDLERLPARLSEQVDKVRDRTAEAVASDGGSVLRELGKVARDLDRVESAVIDRLDEVMHALEETEDHIAELEADSSATTWPRRLFWLAAGAGVGVAAAYYGDPERGARRRHELTEQAGAKASALTEQIVHRVEQATDEVAPDDASSLLNPADPR